MGRISQWRWAAWKPSRRSSVGKGKGKESAFGKGEVEGCCRTTVCAGTLKTQRSWRQKLLGGKIMTSVSSSLNLSFVLKSCCLGDWKDAQDRNRWVGKGSGLEFNLSYVDLESVVVLDMQKAPVFVTVTWRSSWDSRGEFKDEVVSATEVRNHKGNGLPWGMSTEDRRPKMEAVCGQEPIKEDREVEIRRITALQERKNVLWKPKMRCSNWWVVNKALRAQLGEDRAVRLSAWQWRGH